MRRELRAVAGTGLRRGLPAALADELERHTVIDRLADRWLQAVTVVEAPAGYGKSTAVAQAVRDNTIDPTGVDCYVLCRAVDKEPHAFTQTVVRALGSEQPPTAEDTIGLAEAILDRLATFAPQHVCLVLDDVHNLDGGAAEILSQVVRELPVNAHLLLCGRSIPGVPLARLHAQGEVTTIGIDDLAFSTAEIRDLAAAHDLDHEILEDLNGWPAMTRLAVAARRDISKGFVIEEVLDPLGDRLRMALATTIIGGRVDDRTLAQATNSDVTTDEVARSVPLIIELDGGAIAAHDIWHEVLEDVLDESRRRDIATAVAMAHRDAGRIDDCIEIFTADRNWDEAKRTVMLALEGNGAILGAGTATRWLDLFPLEQSDEPEIRLLRGIAARLDAGPTSGMADVELAIEGFMATGTTSDLATALVERGVRAWLLNDSDTINELSGRVQHLADQGNRQMQALMSIALSGIADLMGDPAQAMEHHLSVDFDRELVSIAPLFLRTRMSYAFLLGEGDDGVRYAARVAERSGTTEAEFWLAIAHWQNGNPEPYAAFPDEMRQRWRRSLRDEFLKGVFTCLADASSGISHGIAESLSSPHQRTRERTFETLARCAEAVVEGREPDAVRHMATLVDRVGLDDPQSRNELSRFTAYGYLLHTGVRASLDELDLGPRFQANRDTARALARARDGLAVSWDELPTAPEISCSLPLPWSTELAAHAHAAGSPVGPALADHLLDRAPAATHAALVRLAESDLPGAGGAASLLQGLPVPPEDTTSVTMCGEVTVQQGRGSATTVKRGRVRELLAILVLHDRVRRSDVTSWMWPDLDADAQHNNLRVALTQLRKMLEPDRRAGAPSFHVRQAGEDIWLHRSDRLVVDTWEIEHNAAAAAQAAPRSPHAASAAAAAAASRWTAAAFDDVADLDPVQPAIVNWERLATDAALTAARWDLARGELDAASSVAERLVERDRHNERAWQVLIGVALARDDVHAAACAITACRDALTELNAELDPGTSSLIRRHERRVRTG